MLQVEICCNSFQSAVNASHGGAGRIELCGDLSVGGLTPSFDDVRRCVASLGLRTHVLLRPRPGDFCYSDAEFDLICQQVELCHKAGASAVVVGFLLPDGAIDKQRTRTIVQLATSMQVTFHRAFDECAHPLVALEQIIDCGCHRILTSGHQPLACQGLPLLRQLVTQAAGRISILAGSGITHANARTIVTQSGVSEVHGSCKRSLPDGSIITDTSQVRLLLDSLSGL